MSEFTRIYWGLCMANVCGWLSAFFSNRPFCIHKALFYSVPFVLPLIFDKLISITSNKKSFFDPSPLGWKIPKLDVYSNMSTSTISRTAQGNIYNQISGGVNFPNIGMRHYTTGLWYNVSTGFLACQAVSQTHSNAFAIRSDIISNSILSHIKWGASIRSIQE